MSYDYFGEIMCSQVGYSDDFLVPLGVEHFSLDEMSNMAGFDLPLHALWQHLENMIIAFLFFLLDQRTADVSVAQFSCSDSLASVEHVVVVSLELRWELLGVFQTRSVFCLNESEA